MTRHESIRYVHLRAEECGYDREILDTLKKKLDTLNEEELEHLKRISELVFREWCLQIAKEENP